LLLLSLQVVPLGIDALGVCYWVACVVYRIVLDFVIDCFWIRGIGACYWVACVVYRIVLVFVIDCFWITVLVVFLI
jgi:hypothetical protein